MTQLPLIAEPTPCYCCQGVATHEAGRSLHWDLCDGCRGACFRHIRGEIVFVCPTHGEMRSTSVVGVRWFKKPNWKHEYPVKTKDGKKLRLLDWLIGCPIPYEGKDFATHRAELKMWLMSHRDTECWVEGCHEMPTMMHEAIRRSAVQGWKRRRRVLIQHPYNCICLGPLHHETALEPKMLDIVEWMYLQYGEDYIEWLKSLPFKAHPLKGFIENSQRHLTNS